MKLTKLFLGAMVAVALVSCSGKESMIKSYEKACNDGDAIKAMKIATELSEKYAEEDMTTEDIQRIEKASLILEEKAINQVSDMLNF